jgi:hypothetical protein
MPSAPFSLGTSASSSAPVRVSSLAPTTVGTHLRTACCRARRAPGGYVVRLIWVRAVAAHAAAEAAWTCEHGVGRRQEARIHS